MVCRKVRVLTASILFVFTSVAVHATDLVQDGNTLIFGPPSAAVELRLRGQTHDNAAPTIPATDYGLSITATDMLGSIDNISVPISVGAFRLHRPLGTYLWQFSTSAGAAQQAMELNNDHSLTLHSPAGGTAHSIVLQPGPLGGVFFNGVPLVSSVNTQLATLSVTGAATVGSLNVAGESQLAALNVTSGIAANGGRITNPGDASGVLAVGSNSLALGSNAAAIGENAISFDRSIALGTNAYAGNGNMPPGGSVAIGANSWANNRAMALGDSARAGNGSTAVGVNSLAYGNYGMALLFSETLGWYSMAAHGGKAWADNSYAGSYSTAEGNTSTAIAGGYSKGYKSFAANSGVAWADYSNAIGRGAVTRFPYQVALGTYNDPGLTETQPITSTGLPDTNPIFVIGNGKINVDNNEADDERSNAVTVFFNGDTKLQGALTVDGTPRSGPSVSVFKKDLKVEGGLTVQGGTALAPVDTVFTRNVKVQGVLRVNSSGDVGMGGFTNGPQP